jgi:hypothetical protein
MGASPSTSIDVVAFRQYHPPNPRHNFIERG